MAPQPTASAATPSGGPEQPPLPPEWIPHERPWPGLDRLGVVQAIGGLLLGLIALFSSYDHITIGDHTITLQQQWGIVCIAASLATVLVDAQLATRSRLRAAYEREVDRAGAAEARERQREGFERIDQAALLSARVQLEPTAANRARLRSFLTLMQPEMLEGE